MCGRIDLGHAQKMVARRTRYDRLAGSCRHSRGRLIDRFRPFDFVAGRLADMLRRARAVARKMRRQRHFRRRMLATSTATGRCVMRRLIAAATSFSRGLRAAAREPFVGRWAGTVAAAALGARQGRLQRIHESRNQGGNACQVYKPAKHDVNRPRQKLYLYLGVASIAGAVATRSPVEPPLSRPCSFRSILARLA